MIAITLFAAQMYIDRVNPSASLAEANAAMQPCERIADYCRTHDRAQFRNSTARMITRNGRVVEAWPRTKIVSAGPVSSRLGVLS
jgi:hypothetical protein